MKYIPAYPRVHTRANRGPQKRCPNCQCVAALYLTPTGFKACRKCIGAEVSIFDQHNNNSGKKHYYKGVAQWYHKALKEIEDNHILAL
jgi:hypothetical protein